jgi:hypothetical protein
MSTYLNIMATLSRLDSAEFQLHDERFLLEAGKVPQGVIMVMSGKVELLPDPSKQEITSAGNRRIWGVKEVVNESPFPFWLKGNPGLVYRVVERGPFLDLLKKEPNLRLEVLRMLSSELGIVGGLVTA